MCCWSTQGRLLEMLYTPLRPALAQLHATASPAPHTAPNAFPGDLTSECTHRVHFSQVNLIHNYKAILRWSTSGLLQREPKATADILFISTCVTDCCKMALRTGKEQRTRSHCSGGSQVAQDLIAQKTTVTWAGRSSGIRALRCAFLGEMRDKESHYWTATHRDPVPR